MTVPGVTGDIHIRISSIHITCYWTRDWHYIRIDLYGYTLTVPGPSFSFCSTSIRSSQSRSFQRVGLLLPSTLFTIQRTSNIVTVRCDVTPEYSSRLLYFTMIINVMPAKTSAPYNRSKNVRIISRTELHSRFSPKILLPVYRKHNMLNIINNTG